MKPTTRSLTRAALIAAVYLLLTILFQPISFGAVQFRISEALTLLPVLTVDAVPGLLVGCLLANLLGGGVWYDVALGTIATLLAAICTRRLRHKLPLAALATRKLRNRPLAAAFMPVLFNGLIVGPVVYLAYVRAPGAPISWPILFSSMATVALGELVVCYILGLLLLKVLNRLPEQYLHA